MAAPRNPFRVRQLREMYDVCVRLASDNFSEFYYSHRGTTHGPRFPHGGAGHRCAFWLGYDGTPNIRYDKGSFAYAAYRAGVDFAKGARHVQK